MQFLRILCIGILLTISGLFNASAVHAGGGVIGLDGDVTLNVNFYYPPTHDEVQKLIAATRAGVVSRAFSRDLF